VDGDVLHRQLPLQERPTRESAVKVLFHSAKPAFLSERVDEADLRRTRPHLRGERGVGLADGFRMLRNQALDVADVPAISSCRDLSGRGNMRWPRSR
jgi:hypothetical protein